MAYRFLFACICIVLLSCGKPIRIGLSQEPVSVPLRLSAAGSLSALKEEIFVRIRSGEKVPFGAITRAILEDHHRNYQARKKDPQEPGVEETFFLFEGSLPTGAFPALSDLKTSLEKGLQDSRKKPLDYNASAISVVDVLRDNHLQSYSGTVWTQLALREKWGSRGLEENHAVVIYESGHVLPGYLLDGEQGWELVGVETTVAGRGLVLYGPVKTATKERLLRVVDAQLWAIVELFKFEMSDPVGVSNDALSQTAKQYGIEEVAYLVPERFRREIDWGKIHWSPFSFGTPDVGNQDRTRAEVDERPRAQYPRANPNATIFHQAAPTPPPKDTPTPKPLSSQPDFPYRQLVDKKPEEGAFECWDYMRLEWVPMPVEVHGDDIYVKEHPCLYSRPVYEPLPHPLKAQGTLLPVPRPIPRPTPVPITPRPLPPTRIPPQTPPQQTPTFLPRQRPLPQTRVRPAPTPSKPTPAATPLKSPRTVPPAWSPDPDDEDEDDWGFYEDYE